MVPDAGLNMVSMSQVKHFLWLVGRKKAEDEQKPGQKRSFVIIYICYAFHRGGDMCVKVFEGGLREQFRNGSCLPSVSH